MQLSLWKVLVSDMDLDYNLQIIAANYAVFYLEAEIYSIDKRINDSPTDEYKLQLIAAKGLYNMHLNKLKEWLDSRGK